MTQFIAHRINSTAKLRLIPRSLGIEIDVRDQDKKIILAHDPYTSGEELKTFLKSYQHSFIILNIKSTGLEFDVLKELRKFKIEKFFFLDCSVPMLHKLIIAGEGKHVAIRYSEYEPIEFAKVFSQIVQWIWIDTFHDNLLHNTDIQRLRSMGYKICIASPELQQRNQDIIRYARNYKDDNLVDAVCSKIQNLATWTSIN